MALRSLSFLVFAFFVSLPALALGDASMARAVEGRLLAPCCWNQTLDVHESPLATSLRAEVRARLEAGESSLAIEDDLALRYGERIRAVPRGSEPRGTMMLAVTLALLASVLGVIFAARRWTRPADLPPISDAGISDERLEAELAQLDEG